MFFFLVDKKYARNNITLLCIILGHFHQFFFLVDKTYARNIITLLCIKCMQQMYRNMFVR